MSPAPQEQPETLQQAARRLLAGFITKGSKPEALHEWQGADGFTLYAVAKLRDAQGGKVMRPLWCDPDKGWTLGKPPAPDEGWPLYLLPMLMVVDPALPVWVVEGEACADRLRGMGVIATTSGSSNSAGGADWSPLEGRRCIVWPDFDQPGQRYGDAVAGILEGMGCALEVIDAAQLDLPQGGDVVDWLKAHSGATEFDLQTLPRVANYHPRIEGGEEVYRLPDPKPLPDSLPPVPNVPEEAIPESLRPWILDVSDRLQCPLDFPLVGALVALGGAVGATVGIRPKSQDSWLVVPNLWGAVVGRPGIMKTPALSEVLAPLRRLEALEIERNDGEVEQWRIEKQVRDAAAKANDARIQKAAKAGNLDQARQLALEAGSSLLGECPTPRRLIVNDTTPEKLGDMLAINPKGILAFRDELVGLLSSLDQEGREGARSFFLEAWNGSGGYTFDRIQRGTVRIPRACVAVLGGIQPGPLAGYLNRALKGGAGDDGLLQRFQVLAWPDPSPDWRHVDRWPESTARQQAWGVFERLANLNPVGIGAQPDEEGDGIPFLRFDPDAALLFVEWWGQLERRIRRGDEPPAFEAHLSKYRKLGPALALLIHLADVGTGPVRIESLGRALELINYLEGHARRLYGAATMPEVEAARAIERRIEREDLVPPFTARDVYRRGWAGLDRERAEAGLDLLVDLDRLLVEEEQTGGRPRVTYLRHPYLPGEIRREVA